MASTYYNVFFTDPDDTPQWLSFEDRRATMGFLLSGGVPFHTALAAVECAWNPESPWITAKDGTLYCVEFF